MNKIRTLGMLCLLLMSTACMSGRQGPVGPPPSDPLASISAADLRAQGLSFARSGDLVRGQQYLSAAMQKGFDETVVVPEIVKVCVAASRLRAALAFAEPYLQRHPRDAGMQYVIGTIHMVLGNLEEATSHLSGALQPGDLMGDALFSLALVAEVQGLHELARERLEKYLEVSPRGRNASRARTMLASLGAKS